MAEGYPQLTDGQKLIRFFYEELEAAYEQDEPELLLMIVRGGNQVGVHIVRPAQRNVAEELQLNGARTVSLVRRLDEEGYLRLHYGGSGPHVELPTATIEYIPERGF